MYQFIFVCMLALYCIYKMGLNYDIWITNDFLKYATVSKYYLINLITELDKNPKMYDNSKGFIP